VPARAAADDNLLYGYPPGSVAVSYEVTAAVRLERAQLNSSDRQRSADDVAPPTSACGESAPMERDGQEAPTIEQFNVDCMFIGCISGQAPLEWKLEYVARVQSK
jgi:hypothetical protein